MTATVGCQENVRMRPLGAGYGIRGGVSYTRRRFPARRYLAELPQGRKAARVSELFRVRGEPFVLRAVRFAVRDER